MSNIFKFFLFVFGCLGMASSQSPINPQSQIRWPLITGTADPVTPAQPCTSVNFGQPYEIEDEQERLAGFACGASDLDKCLRAIRYTWRRNTSLADFTFAEVGQ